MLARRLYYMKQSALVAKLATVGTRKWLIRELDSLTSRIVRARDKRCVTCGNYMRLECSHFYSRRYLNTRFDLVNCNAQCHRCNQFHIKNPWPYFDYMQAHYGEQAVEELNQRRLVIVKVSDADLRNLLIERRAML